MTFQESIKVCFTKYADFSGRASRSLIGLIVIIVFLAQPGKPDGGASDVTA